MGKDTCMLCGKLSDHLITIEGEYGKVQICAECNDGLEGLIRDMSEINTDDKINKEITNGVDKTKKITISLQEIEDIIGEYIEQYLEEGMLEFAGLECYVCGSTHDIDPVTDLCIECAAELEYCTDKFGLDLVPIPKQNTHINTDVHADVQLKITPKQILEKLDEVVINQDHSKKTLATEVYKHYLRINHEEEYRKLGHKPQKTNIIMTGMSGTGKTLIAKTLADIVGVPFIIADATGMTEAGYVGEDVESMLHSLINAAGGDLDLAEKGIIMLDEIDKIARKGENMSITRDVSGEGVQQAILKIVEGTTVNVPMDGKRKNPTKPMFQIDTSNILFIAGGAFTGIDEIVKARLKSEANPNSGGSIGFNSTIKSEEKKTKDQLTHELRSKITPEDLRKFGIIPELLGRFSTITNLNPLTTEDLVKILTDSKSSILKNYEILFSLEGKTLTYSENAPKAIAELAIKRGVGARGLQSIVDEIIQDILFDLPDLEETDITINDDLTVTKSKKIA